MGRNTTDIAVTLMIYNGTHEDNVVLCIKHIARNFQIYISWNKSSVFSIKELFLIKLHEFTNGKLKESQ